MEMPGERSLKAYFTDRATSTAPRSEPSGCAPQAKKGFLTVKGITNGVTRSEFEYEIPFSDADKMLSGLAEKPLIEKRRFKIPAGSLVWEIDEFLGENAGLIVAEIELPDEDAPFERPDWLGREVSNDPRYFNSNLVRHPFSQWQV